MAPYVGLAFLLILIGIAIASQKAPPIVEEFPDAGPHEGGTRALFGVLWRNKRYRFGVVAQFSNVGGAGVHVDVPDPVRGAGARRQPREGRRLPAGEPLDLPRARAFS